MKILLADRTIRISILWLVLALTPSAYGDEGDMNESRIAALKNTFDVPLVDAEVTFKVLYDSILSAYNEKAHVQIYDSFSMMRKDIKNGQIDAVVANAPDVLMLKEMIDPDAISTIVIRGRVKHRWVMLTRKNISPGDWNALKGKRLTTSRNVALGNIVLDVALLEAGFRPSNKFFRSSIAKESPHPAIIDVFFGKADAALVTEAALEVAEELNPQIGKRLNVFMRSEPYLLTVNAYLKSFPADRKEKLKEATLKFHELPKGVALLRLFKAERVEIVTWKDLENVKELVTKYKRLTKSKN